jgi:hypothetical protein
MKKPINLSREELAKIITEGIRILYGTRQEDGSWAYAADKEWSGADVCQELASLFNHFDLLPHVSHNNLGENPCDFVNDQTKAFRKAHPGLGSVTADHCRTVVSICGGIIQDIYCSDPHARIVVIDWDTEGCEPSVNGIVEMREPSGRNIYVYVADFHTQPMNNLSGTEIEEALGVANCQDILYGPERGAG